MRQRSHFAGRAFFHCQKIVFQNFGGGGLNPYPPPLNTALHPVLRYSLLSTISKSTCSNCEVRRNRISLLYCRRVCRQQNTFISIILLCVALLLALIAVSSVSIIRRGQSIAVLLNSRPIYFSKAFCSCVSKNFTRVACQAAITSINVSPFDNCWQKCCREK